MMAIRPAECWTSQPATHGATFSPSGRVMMHARNLQTECRQPDSATWQPPSLPCGLRDSLATDSARADAGALTPADRAALPIAIQAYQAGLRPASDDAFEAAMMRLALVFQNNRMEPAEIRARLLIYREALDDLPADLMDKAARLAIRQCRFFPLPAELRQLVEAELIERRANLHRAMMLERGR